MPSFIHICLMLSILTPILSEVRNLQFSHHVQGYLPEDFPPQFFLFLYDTGNILDPYVVVGANNAIIGYGSTSRNPVNIIAQCLQPLEFINGACQCPNGGRLFDLNGKEVCVSKDSITGINQQCVISQKRIIQDGVDDLSALLSIYRDYDGSFNNIDHPQWGKTDTPLQRLSNNYKDQIQQPKQGQMSARQISNIVGSIDSQQQNRNTLGLSMAFVIFGQFLDHDIDLTQAQHISPETQAEYMNITIPELDSFFKNQSYFQFTRSQFMPGMVPRAYPNMITTWVDGSQIYGSIPAMSCQLRTLQGGKLRVSDGNLLPIIQNFFRAGDIRAIQNTILATYHTIFVRQHNRMCDRILQQFPDMNDQQIFQIARNYVIGLFQKIVYKQFLPKYLGVAYSQIGQYKGYNPTVNPTLSIQFTTAAFRGHGLLASTLNRVDHQGNRLDPVKLNSLFFNQSALNNQNMDNLLRGLQFSPMKQKSPRLIDDLRNLLTLDPSNREVRLDLFALNVQRSRDHGIGSYNDIRQLYNLPRITSFSEILPLTLDGITLKQHLEEAYGSPDNMDLWVGIMAQKHLTNSALGRLGATIVSQAFRNIRDGDRFWYQNTFPPTILAQIQETTLSDVVRRNTGAKNIPDDFFALSF